MAWGSPGKWRRGIIILFGLSLSCFRAQFQTERPDPESRRPDPGSGQKKGRPKAPLLAEDSPQPVEILRLTYVINIKLCFIRCAFHQQTDDLIVVIRHQVLIRVITIRLVFVEAIERYIN